MNTLPAAARYFPLEKGAYEVAPGLKTLGSDFGNGPLEAQVFQFDRSFPIFRASKLAARRENLSKYYIETDYPPLVAEGVTRMLVNRLVTESPEYFQVAGGGGRISLLCRLTGETLIFDSTMMLVAVENCAAEVTPSYASAFDALALQVAEDLNIVTLREDGSNGVSAMHVCSPSSWRPEEKAGRDFMQVHAPVPESTALLKASKAIVSAMVYKGPYVRFVWGLTTNPQPNHHPDPPSGVSHDEWRGLPLTKIADGVPVYMWVERQVVWGCPEAQSSLFTIRASFNPLAHIRENARERELFRSTLISMSAAVRDYKGLNEAYDSILTWLSDSSGRLIS